MPPSDSNPSKDLPQNPSPSSESPPGINETIKPLESLYETIKPSMDAPPSNPSPTQPESSASTTPQTAPKVPDPLISNLLPETPAHNPSAPQTAPPPVTQSPGPVPTSTNYLGRFLIQKELGKGAYGTVYLCKDEELKRTVAIKVPHPDYLNLPGFREDYLKEAQVLAQMKHPSIVEVLEISDNPFFLVSNYIEGTNLEAKMKKGRMSFAEVAHMVEAIALGLQHAHSKGLVHRDLKPGNILIDLAGKPYIADFGMALHDDDFGKGIRKTGTPLYNSPEQARSEGHRVDGRSDLFSLGIILYELLTGRHPFLRGNPTREELFRVIINDEPKPPQQFDELIPKPLIGICLQCLAKEPKERFQSGHELAQALRNYIVSAGPSAEMPRILAPALSESLTSTPLILKTPISDLEQIRVVPKGLRSFDEDDSSFFLALLPGVRGLDDLPESIRYWKTRIERIADSFSVGLIYGPSGCGKSSLVRAGILPHLDPAKVASVYVEAAPGQTENRFLAALRKLAPNLPENSTLKDAAIAIRKGRSGIATGKKILIVLDQFEQWLHERQGAFSGDLADALRQFDGVHAQCLLLVREDFWMPITRFVKALGIDLVPDSNIQGADLFDMAHATRVLRALGRAYGQIPEFPKEPKPSQKDFLRLAVEGLAQENRVISVRLAMFAQMLKSCPWTPESLNEVGGVQGLGIAFLEETFGGKTTSPEYRFHQKAVRGVLNSLLPEAGTDIKGRMRSREELQKESGYGDHPQDFEALLRILDRELRLITPTDLEGKDDSESPGFGKRGESQVDPENPHSGESGYTQYFQLAHDYLVPSIRDWLRRKQKETAKGRAEILAEILLEERAALWKDKKQSRHLPSLPEYLRIAWYTKPFERTQAQKEMVGHAGWFHGLRAGLLITLIFFLSLIAWEGYGRLESRRLRDRLLESTTADLPGIVNELVPYRRWVDPLLKAAYAQAETDQDPRKRLRASLGLLPTDPTQLDYLYGQLLQAPPQEFVVIREELSRHKADLTPKLWSIFEDSRAPMDQRFHAACGLAAYAPEDPRWEKTSNEMAAMLAMQKPFVIGAWTEALQGIGASLLPPLAQILVDENRGLAERGLIATVYDKLAKDQTDGYARLEKQLEEKSPADANEETKTVWAKKQASLSLALLIIGKGEKVWPLLRHSPDPTVRSFLIDRMGPWGVEAKTLFDRLDGETDVSIRGAILLSLGEYGPDRLSLSDRQNQIPRLLDWYREDPDPGIHGATEWLLRQWKAQDAIDSIDKALSMGKVEGKRQWFLNREGHTMVIIPKTEPFFMGEGDERQRVQINRKFSIASKEVTVDQFLRFRKEQKYEESVAPTKDCPIHSVSWYDTAAYSNWLSEKEGIPKEQWCYLPNKDGKYNEGMELAPNYLQRSGYRLPTEAEWEFACRVGSMTNYSFGDSAEQLEKYGWFNRNSFLGISHPVAGLKSNDLGFFDMHGNDSEWCLDTYERNQNKTDDSKIINDIEKSTKIDPKIRRVLRGGSFLYQASWARSAVRLPDGPANGVSYVGFRLARTITP